MYFVEPWKMGNFSCFQELVRQKAVASWYDLQKWHIDPDSGQGGAMFINVFPRQLTCPLKRDRFKQRCHLNQPLIFRGLI